MKSTHFPAPEHILPGRNNAMQVTNQHFVTGNPIKPPFPAPLETALFGLGCFWGAEKKFWQYAGVYSTAVGYTGGQTPHPTYEEVCTGLTAHNEVVFIVYDPNKIGYPQLLKVFWENHNPTQGMRQGNDIGTQYRSAIYFYTAQQQQQATHSLEQYQQQLSKAGHAEITTEISAAEEFYYAEDYHQAYLAKNPAGYCGLGGLSVCYPDIEG